MNGNNLQDTLYGLIQSGSFSSPALNVLLNDYIRYHAVLFIEGGIFMLFLMGLSIHFWKQFFRMQKIHSQAGAFEKRTYLCFGLVGTGASIFMLFIVMANLSNVVNPRAGFFQSIPDLGTPQAGTQKAALYEAVNDWVQSDSPDMPVILHMEVQKRLSWQQPKAIFCSILLVMAVVFTARIWKTLIVISRAGRPKGRLKEMALFSMGVTAVPVTLLLMILSLANTQASFAPITLTLLFSQ